MLMHSWWGQCVTPRAIEGGRTGGHAISRNGMSWTDSEIVPLTIEVQFTDDGTFQTIRRRERPRT